MLLQIERNHLKCCVLGMPPGRLCVSGTSHWMETLGQTQDLLKKFLWLAQKCLGIIQKKLQSMSGVTEVWTDLLSIYLLVFTFYIISEWYRTTLTLQEDPCKKYYEALIVNPILLVSPMKVRTVSLLCSSTHEKLSWACLTCFMVIFTGHHYDHRHLFYRPSEAHRTRHQRVSQGLTERPALYAPDTCASFNRTICRGMKL